MEDINQIARDILSEFGTKTIAKLAMELQRLDKVASGKLLNSLEVNVRDFITSIILEFSYEDYGKWVELGRTAGKYVPVKALKDWCIIRGIDVKYSFAINQKIFQLGIKPVSFVDNVINSDRELQEVINQTEELYQKEVEILLEKMFK